MPLGGAAARRRPGAAPHRAGALAWRGLYAGSAAKAGPANPVDGVRAPRAAQPLPKALSVDDAVALVGHRDDAAASPMLAARDACIAELLYGCGLRVGELVGLDAVASAEAAGWIDAADASAHVLGKGSSGARSGRQPPRGARGWLARRASRGRRRAGRSSSAARHPADASQGARAEGEGDRGRPAEHVHPTCCSSFARTCSGER